MRLCKHLGIALLVSALFMFPALAQVASGILAGTVIDESGGVLPGVEVTVTNQGTNRVAKAVTSGVGSFRITNLNPGLYEVRVALEGFKTYVARDVKINVDEEYSITVKLEVGSVSDELTVVAGVDLVKTTDTQISTTIGQRQIIDLPLNGRNPLALITLQAGTGTNGNTSTAISGLRTSFTNITQDGVNIQDNFIRSNATNFVPNRLTQSQVGEFTVAIQNQSVSSGFGASQVNFVTPSGTNNYHGELYWVHRNNATAATEFFDNLTGTPKAPLIRNQVGFSVAGPIVKDKLLFYANYEAFRERAAGNVLQTVLTPSARTGLFRYVETLEDRTTVLHEINILAERGFQIDPLIQSFIAQTPAINDFSTGDSSPGQLLNTGGYRFNQTDNEDRDQWGFRLDYNLNDRHSFEGIYRWSDFSNDRPDITDTFGGFGQTPVVQTVASPKFFSTAWNWTISENIINEVRFGANLAPVIFETSQDRSRGFKITLAGSFTNPENSFERQGRDTDTWIFQDNASWQRGNHSLRFGVQSQSVRIFDFSGFDVFPNYTLGVNTTNNVGFSASDFPGITPSSLSTANELIADLPGVLDSANQNFSVTSRTSGFQPIEDQKNWQYDIIGLYLGDQWRVHPRLTMNLGLRWEYYNQLREQNGLITQPRVTGNVFNAVLDPNNVVDFIDGRLINNDFGNFAPTVGFAWDVFGDGKTAVRGAYGIAYVNDEIQRAPGNAINQFVVNAGVSFEELDSLLSQGLPAIPVPDFVSPLSFDDIRTTIDPFLAAFAVDPDLQVPYAQTWTLGIQREIGWNTAIEARYVGTHGTKLVRSFDLNQTIIRENGFLEDFLRAQNNGFLAAAADPNRVFNPAYNPNIPGSQPLPVFANIIGGGLLTRSDVRRYLQEGRAGQLASLYHQFHLLGFTSDVPFVANQSVFVADAVVNGADSTYHALQLEVTRRFTEGLTFNANYTFGKTLTNSAGEGQTNFDPILDLANPGYDRNRAAYDVTHTFNANMIFELPFGRGRRFDIANNVLDKVFGGWEVTSIFNIQSGDPFGLLSNRGTLNRDGRSLGRNRASSTLGNSGVRDLIGVGSNANGPFFLDPAMRSNFTNPAPGELGNLPRFGWNGPSQFNWDFGVVKRTPVTEDVGIEFRAEFFNFTNRPNFNVGNAAQSDARLDINSPNFGRIGFTNTSARIVQFSLKVTF